MKVRYLAAMTLALTVSAGALAEDGQALYKKSGCSACHALNKKNVGPAFTEVAAKYAGDSTAQARLEKKVRSGGAGSFGSMPMPPAPAAVSDDSIKTLVAWILTQK
ncbi:MAG: c-type cytochrome [Gallionella sp.]|jgi:cytochrome c|uniref:Cytochrome c-551 (Cytochrome c551) (Cytochrome C8) n=1 Tax=mine drainage metagenome TaxID=410659 RepID=E6QNF8_9ZZZZ|nr:c-type cytochrome [Gallionella sp.]